MPLLRLAFFVKVLLSAFHPSLSYFAAAASPTSPSSANGEESLATEPAWPRETFAEKSDELVGAGQRLSKWLVCSVCKARVTSLSDAFRKAAMEMAARGLEGEDDVEDRLGGVKNICKMKDLATLLRTQRLEVVLGADGTASMKSYKHGPEPKYLDAIEKDKFHYKSYAVQRACTSVFRAGLSDILSGVLQTVRAAGQRGDDEALVLMSIGSTARMLCERVKPCRQETARWAARHRAMQAAKASKDAAAAGKTSAAAPASESTTGTVGRSRPPMSGESDTQRTEL